MKSHPALRNFGLATLASLTLGGCYYGDVNGASYAGYDCSSRYGDRYWSNDPFAYDDGYYGYDCYDAADYGSGFAQIGFGGGWHQQLYYPGFGLFLFDRFGRRHNMGNDTLTYWGGRRAWWKHHGHRYGDQGYRRGGDHRHDGRRDGWRGRPRDGSPGGYAPGASPPIVAPDAGIAPDALPAPQIRRPGGNGWGGNGAGQGGGNWAPPTAGVRPADSDAAMQQPGGPRIPSYTPPTIGNDGATVQMTRPAPPPRAAPAAPDVSYAPPPAARLEEQSRDHGGPIRED